MKLKYPYRAFAIIGLLLAFNWGVAQQKSIDEYRKKYPNIGEIILNETQTLYIKVVNDNIEAYTNHFEESLIIDDDVKKRVSNGAVPYSTFREIKSIEANSWINNNGKYKKIDIKDFRIVPDKSKRTFHDDVKYKQFDYPQLGLGAKKTLKYTIKYPEPRLLNGDYFTNRFPVEYKEFTVITDHNIDLGYKVFNNNDQRIKFQKETKNDKIIYKWTTTDLPKYLYEEHTPNSSYFTPIVEVYIKNYTTKNGEKRNILNSLDDLHSLYESYIKGIGENPSPELQKQAQLLKNKHTNELDQVKEIYYWVKNNVKYIAFEDGYGGFIPRNGNDVFHKLYGDCKDMSSIIYTMAKSVGIENIYITWIGSREKPFKYEEIPTQMVDDHMIVTYENNGKYYFLDGTSRNTPFDYPSFFIQGKQALIHKGPGSYKIALVPIIDADLNKRKDIIHLKLEDNKIIGKSESTYTGFQRDEFIEILRDYAGFQKTQTLKEILELGNNKFYLEKYTIDHQEDRDKDLKINFDFNIDNYLIKSGNEIYLNLALNKFREIHSVAENRVYDYEINNTNTYQGEINFEIPFGYEVTYLPQSKSSNNDLFSYSFNYSQTKQLVTLKMDVKINYILLKKENFNRWNAFVSALQENLSESISLQKK